MPDFRLRLTLTSPLATPLHSGTLFGHLCWVRHYFDGEEILADWLATQSTQPWLLSDAFPAGYLPRPLLPPADRSEQQTSETRKAFIARLEKEKKERKQSWLAVDDFLTLRDDLREESLITCLTEAPGTIRSVRQAHNTINRHTGTTPSNGGLYFMPEQWADPQAAELDVYVRAETDAVTLADWFGQLGEFGFGRDASLGRGQFKVVVESIDPELFNYQGNRLMSLSHGTISPNMAACRYKLHTHFGKLGGLYAGGTRSPFKYPLTLIRPGATFSPTDDGPYGELLSGVHPHHPEICHHAFHFCLAYTESV